MTVSSAGPKCTSIGIEISPPNVPLELVQTLAPRLRTHFERPTIARSAALLAALAGLPSITTGLQVDDLFHEASLQRLPPYGAAAKSPLELFTFFDGDHARTEALVRDGVFGWWTHPAIRLAFFRPIAALTHAFDHRLYGGHPWLMHVHSLLWAALAVFVAGLLYRRLLGATSIAGLAAIMYALNDSHALPYTWIAQRNACMAAAFGLLTLHFHRTKSPFLAAGTFAIALGCGESALGTLGFLAAHALCLEDDAWRARIRRLLLYVPVLVAWVFIYRHFGFGTQDSALYIDPGRDPLRFVEHVVTRFPMLVTAALIAAPIDAAFFLPERAAAPVAIVSVVITVLLARWLRPVLRQSATARFFALGTAIALIPCCATIPSGRLLMLATFGMMGLFAEAIAFHRSRAMLRLRLYVSPVLLVLGSFQMALAGNLIDRFSSAIPVEPAVASQDVILVTSFDAAGAGYVTLERQRLGLPVPQQIHVMAVGDQDVDVTRLDDRTLVVRPRNGFLADAFSRLFRSAPFAVGERVRWTHAWIEVTSLSADGRAAEARFVFDEALESNRYRWMVFRGKALAPFALPNIGATVTVPPGRVF